jgi:hypothetical protein
MMKLITVLCNFANVPTNSSSAPIYVHFEHIIEELGGNHKCIFQEATTLLLWKFFGKDNKNIHKIKKNTDSREVIFTFHCIRKLSYDTTDNVNYKVNPFKADIYLKHIQNLSSYLTESTVGSH